jgi:hypothetical protein
MPRRQTTRTYDIGDGVYVTITKEERYTVGTYYAIREYTSGTFITAEASFKDAMAVKNAMAKGGYPDLIEKAKSLIQINSE